MCRPGKYACFAFSIFEAQQKKKSRLRNREHELGMTALRNWPRIHAKLGPDYVFKSPCKINASFNMHRGENYIIGRAMWDTKYRFRPCSIPDSASVNKHRDFE